jgi:hypothetical protein
MSTYEHTVKLRQKEDEKKTQPNLNSNRKASIANFAKNNQKEMISIISKAQTRPPTPPIVLKHELPPINISHIDPNLGDGAESDDIKQSLPPLPPLKMTSNNNQRLKNKLNSLDDSLNVSNSDKKYKNNQSIDHALPCIMPQKNYLDLNEIMNSESRDSSYFSGYPTNRTDVEQLNTDSDQNNRERKTASNIIKLPPMPTDDNRLTMSALSDTLENKRKRRKQLLNLSATPQSNMSNSSSPEPQLLQPINNSSTSIKYLNSSNLNKFNTLSQTEKSNFRDLKNVTPSTTVDGQDSDDDIIIGNNNTKTNMSDNFLKNYKNVKS